MVNATTRSHAGVEETRARILAAARTVFERNGTRGTTTREVADRAGVNEATLFRHFGSKRALLDAMREASCGANEMREVLASLAPDDLRGALRTIAVHAARLMTEKRAMMCISLAEDAIGTDDAPEWRGPTSMLDEVCGYFREHITAGRLRGDELMMSRCFLGMMFSYIVGRKLWNRDETTDPAVLDGMVDLFLNGVRT